MTDGGQAKTSENIGAVTHGFEQHRRRQARLGLRLSPAERLRWLEESMEEFRKLLGRARQGRRVSPG